jgi:endonuclease/exonuclease/phosphatase family metal-dependent hydrolase
MKKDLAENSIKLVSVNIELEKHLDRVRAFLKKEKPDVICLQEVYELDLAEFAKEFAMKSAFGQMSLIGRGEYTKPPFAPYGVGILSALPMQEVRRAYYTGSEQEAKTREFQGNSQSDPHLLLIASVKKEDKSFTIGTTHFTWSADGESDDAQKKDIQRLLAVAKEFPEIILAGDFNAPRGRQTFDTISKQYTDNIPERYTTSIDSNLHRDGEKIRGKQLMVDGLFSTKGYECCNVRLQSGVSDHMAIVAEVKNITQL